MTDYGESQHSPQVDFFYDGVVLLPLEGAFGDLIRKAASDMFHKTVANDEVMEEKYAGSVDLRPATAQRFQDIEKAFATWAGKKTVEDILQRPISLNIIQIRRAVAGQSYMSTHRDTYIDGEKLVGNVPAIPKLIFYHAADDEPQLRFYLGSHRRFFRNKYIDRFFNLFFSPKTDLKADGKNIVLFDTFSVHSVPNLKKDAVRVILSLKYEH
jgi:hypothetical protein